MKFNDYQQEVDKWINASPKGYWPPLSILAKMQEELGEVAAYINTQHGERKLKPGEVQESLDVELGDLLIAICCLANTERINLDQAFEEALQKAYGRKDEPDARG